MEKYRFDHFGLPAFSASKSNYALDNQTIIVGFGIRVVLIKHFCSERKLRKLYFCVLEIKSSQ